MKLANQVIFSDRNEVYEITVRERGTYAFLNLKKDNLQPKDVEELIHDLQSVRAIMGGAKASEIV